jgi:hypothetical protein
MDKSDLRVTIGRMARIPFTSTASSFGQSSSSPESSRSFVLETWATTEAWLNELSSVSELEEPDELRKLG